MIVEFPRVNVNIRAAGSRGKSYMQELGVPTLELPEALAYALASGVEIKRAFLGATIDAYAEGARSINPGLEKRGNFQFLDAMINGFAREGLIYGIALSRKQEIRWSNYYDPIDNFVICMGESSYLERESRDVLETMEDMNEFLKNGVNYDWQKVSLTVFVPSVKFTENVWGFSYDPLDLCITRKYEPGEEVSDKDKGKEPKVINVHFQKPKSPLGPGTV